MLLTQIETPEVLLHAADAATGLPESENTAFAEALTKAVHAIIEPQKNASKAIEAFANGNDGPLHNTMLAIERADLSMKFLMSVRNKCLEAYREIMHMGS